jgi:hypothetical protein
MGGHGAGFVPQALGPHRLSHGHSTKAFDLLRLSERAVTYSTDALRSLMHVYGAEGRRGQEILENEDPTRRPQDISVVQQTVRHKFDNSDRGHRVPGVGDIDFGVARRSSTDTGADQSPTAVGPMRAEIRVDHQPRP